MLDALEDRGCGEVDLLGDFLCGVVAVALEGAEDQVVDFVEFVGHGCRCLLFFGASLDGLAVFLFHECAMRDSVVGFLVFLASFVECFAWCGVEFSEGVAHSDLWRFGVGQDGGYFDFGGERFGGYGGFH